MNAKPFHITTDETRLAWIKQRLADATFPPPVQVGDGEDVWSYGTSVTYMRDLRDWWLAEYDWQNTVDELNRFKHFTTMVDGLNIHFIREDGSGTNPKPLLMTHGWPGSIYEFVDVIDRLAHPENHGGEAEDGVTVICPSLPGYVFSDKPPRPLGQTTTAAMWNKLMVDRLGFERYVAQGGDWGSLVTALLGLNHGVDQGGGCEAVHINMYGLRGSKVPETDAEKQWADGFAALSQQEAAYLQLQATKPQSLAMAMTDSPLGVAAWIIEKFHGWSDIGKGIDRDLAKRYSRHQLVSNIMLYLMTDCFATSTWYYRGFFEEMPHIPADSRIGVPCGIGNFAEPFFTFPPRSLMEDDYNIVHWADYDEVGHFAAMEDPEIFTAEVQGFLKKL